MNELELYLHIPFCKKKCNYCDFLSWPAADEEIEKYINSLTEEIKACSETYAGFNITSIFIGGGTPSILSVGQISKIINTLKESFDLSALKPKKKRHVGKIIGAVTGFGRVRDAYSSYVPGVGNPALEGRLSALEFTIESNPGTLDMEKLKAYRELGINRLSMGLQSTNDSELKKLGRIHNVDEFLKSFDMAREAGFDNINIDLMQAIPDQTLESWKKGLMMVSMLRPEHISAYSLIIEEGTPFYEKMNSDDPLKLPDEDEEREIYYSTKEILEKMGYQRYEISNYALPGMECRHNLGYWRRKNYLGLGLGASSMVDNVRWKNTPDMKTYLENSGCPEKLHIENEKLSRADQMAEFMFLGLRTMKGVAFEDFIDTFGESFDHVYGDVSAKLEMEGLISFREEEEYDKEKGKARTKTWISLTERGIDVSNVALAEFLPD